MAARKRLFEILHSTHPRRILSSTQMPVDSFGSQASAMGGVDVDAVMHALHAVRVKGRL